MGLVMVKHECDFQKEDLVKEKSLKGITVLYVTVYCDCGKSKVIKEEQPTLLFEDFIRATKK
jgi:hypothetical protein